MVPCSLASPGRADLKGRPQVPSSPSASLPLPHPLGAVCCSVVLLYCALVLYFVLYCCTVNTIVHAARFMGDIPGVQRVLQLLPLRIHAPWQAQLFPAAERRTRQRRRRNGGRRGHGGLIQVCLLDHTVSNLMVSCRIVSRVPFW